MYNYAIYFCFIIVCFRDTYFCTWRWKWHHINEAHKHKGAAGKCKMSLYCQQSLASCKRSWHANIHSFGLVTETPREWRLAGSAFKCGYWGPQILTECQIPRNYWCTQSATAPDTSQTESLNVTDKWIFMKLGERKQEQEEKKNTEWEAG